MLNTAVLTNTVSLTSLDDEQLVVLYQEYGDEEAFNTLFRRYEPLLKRKAKRWGSLNRISPDNIHRNFVYQFWRAVQKYNPDQGASFRTWLYLKLSKASYDTLVSEKYTQNYTQKRTEKKREKTLQLKREFPLHSVKDVTETDFSEVIVQDLFDYLKTKGEIYPLILKLIIKGYTYDEISRYYFGREGTKASAKNWVKRIKKKIEKYVEEYYGM